MKSILKKIPLHDLWDKPIMFDANIFMVGIEYRATDPKYSFESITKLYIQPIFESFKHIYIHEEVYRELDREAKDFVDQYIPNSVTIVRENNLYGTDPMYTTIFNHIAEHELVGYSRNKSKDRGEVFSLAYAGYYGINYFCSREIMVDIVAQELEDLEKVSIVTFDIIILTAYVYYARKNDSSYSKSLKAIYKRYCADVIKRHKLPGTLSEYIREIYTYL